MGTYGLGSTGVITPSSTRIVASATGNTCPAGYTPAIRTIYDAMGRAINVNYCKRNAACVDAAQTFHVDDVVAFSWKVLDAAGREQAFMTPDVRVGSWFSRGATGFQLASRALRQYPESRVGRAVSSVCVTLVRSAMAGSGPVPGSATLDTPVWTIMGGGAAATPPSRPWSVVGGGRVVPPPGTAPDAGGGVEAPPDTAADGEGGSVVSHSQKYRGVIAAVALAAAAYAGYRVYKAGKTPKGNRRRSRRRR